jgi:hypothetical protein
MDRRDRLQIEDLAQVQGWVCWEAMATDCQSLVNRIGRIEPIVLPMHVHKSSIGVCVPHFSRRHYVVEDAAASEAVMKWKLRSDLQSF